MNLYIEKIRILKFGHIVRNGHSMERLVVRRQVEGKRSRVRLSKLWTDLIKAATQTSIVQLSRISQQMEVRRGGCINQRKCIVVDHDHCVKSIRLRRDIDRVK